ncbi:GNAT family N-acetyltransferase (plasmid) [Pseudorhodobacter turbinis]|uniref:GNAT family N-acetyltransferase n=1 Tax=Pseudorhodobacter turbinis TaxID=2500533 RepID=A0A4P8EKS7_9RHOB|nr:GNAT family N-acetyltransferase [Pseudorhodobacter turbinis]QCO57533.1 GNAT family N-acetyltransferase [Pseudorhodobacter turbinis]
MIRWREALRADVPAIVALLRDDALGQARESTDIAEYTAAFDAMSYEYGNALIVGEADGRVVATYQLTFITGLSLRASRRAQVESVRVAAKVRSEGVGSALMRDAEMRATHAGCTLIQLTSDKTREDAQRFYERAGYAPSHIGFKKRLDQS